MKEYFKRLKNHLGLDLAVMMTILCFLAGASNKSFDIWWHGAVFGILISLIPWIIILISNRK